MGLIANLKQKRKSMFANLRRASRGVFSPVPPASGTRPDSADEVKRRLLSVSGKGIETTEDDGEVVVAWAAKVSSSGPGGAVYQYLYRALKIDLEPETATAAGICVKTDSEAELDLSSFGFSKSWFRGQELGFEDLYVVAWLGPHSSEDGADEGGYHFSWSLLREPVIEAVTGAGWTYRPKQQ